MTRLAPPSIRPGRLCAVLALAVLVAGCVVSRAPQEAGVARAAGVYAQHCASCHGADLRGRPGVPALSGAPLAWGRSTESLVRTLSHGIRAPGVAGTRGGVMPGFKANAAEFTEAEVAELVAYLMQMRGEAADTAAAARGREHFSWCIDCHGPAGRGKTALGAPSLVAPRLLYGSSPADLFQSIAQGRAGSCPPWAVRLGPADIDALAHFIAAQPD